jgi:hypothetical protein
MTDFVSETPEARAEDADSVQRMDRLRAALVADMRHTTAADAKGNRKMAIGALSVLAVRSLHDEGSFHAKCWQSSGMAVE